MASFFSVRSDSLWAISEIFSFNFSISPSISAISAFLCSISEQRSAFEVSSSFFLLSLEEIFSLNTVSLVWIPEISSLISLECILYFSSSDSIVTTVSSIAEYSVFAFSSFSFASSNCDCTSANSPLYLLKSFLYSSDLSTYKEQSNSFNSSYKLKYFLAFSEASLRGSSLASSSTLISLIRVRFSSSALSSLIAFSLRFLNVTMLAASSNNSLFSSFLPLKILSILPWPIIE